MRDQVTLRDDHDAELGLSLEDGVVNVDVDNGIGGTSTVSISLAVLRGALDYLERNTGATGA